MANPLIFSNNKIIESPEPLLETQIVSPQNGDILQYNGTKWINVPGSGDTTVTTSIPAGTEVVVFSSALSGLISLEFLVNIRKADFTASRTEKWIVNRLTSSLQDSIYGRVGSSINCELATQISGPNAELKVKNNEAFDILVSYKKFVLI